MENQLPPLLGLEAFEAAARHENFAIAADELAVSQSTVSHRVRSLEAHLGQPLFERLPRGVRLTEYGRAYLPSVRGAFEQVIGSTVGVFGRPIRARLTVRAPVSYAALWLPPVVERFQQEHPHVSITVTSSIWTERLSTDDVDIDLRLGRGEWPGLDAEALFADPLIVVASPPTSESLTPTVDHLIEQPLVHLMGGDDQWGRFFATFDRARATDSRDVRVDSTLSAFGFVVGSSRLALAQRRLAEPLLAQGTLARVLPDELGAEERLYLTVPRREVRPRAEAVLFREWLLDQRL